ncbi:MAG: murein biosynthesis integral membrane protein MurJ [archaeon]|nr:murein biosynthesis integral membrane protein MurJ [archaeon]
MEKNKGLGVIKSASIVIVVTLISKLLGFVREICMGSSFGTSIESDIYFWAMSVTTVIFMAIATAVASAMLPTLNEYRLKKENDKLKKYINKIFTLSFIVSVVIIAILVITSPWFVKLIAVKYSGSELDLAIQLVRILSISFLFIMVAYIAKTILQANEKFFMYSIISLPYNIFIILYLIFFSDKFGIEGLALVTVCGWLCQYLIQIPSLRKCKSKFGFNFKLKDDEVKKFVILFLPLLVSSLIYSINTLVDKSIALNLDDGKVAGLNYGYNIYQSIATTIIIGISTVLYPKFVESKVVNSKEEFKEEIISVLKIMTYIALPLMVCFIVLNKQIVEVAYMRNSFTAESVELTRFSLIFYSLGTLSYTFQEMLLKIFYSLKESKIPMITSIITVVLNIALDIWLVQTPLNYKGLALATTIAVTLNAIMLFVALEKRFGSLRKRKILLTFIKAILSLVLPGIACYFIINNLYVTGASLIINFLVILLAVAVSGILYFVSSYILRMEETEYILTDILKIKKKKNIDELLK